MLGLKVPQTLLAAAEEVIECGDHAPRRRSGSAVETDCGLHFHVGFLPDFSVSWARRSLISEERSSGASHAPEHASCRFIAVQDRATQPFNESGVLALDPLALLKLLDRERVINACGAASCSWAGENSRLFPCSARASHPAGAWRRVSAMTAACGR